MKQTSFSPQTQQHFQPLSVWCLLDSRPGHTNQTLGLTDALQRQTRANISRVEIRGVADGIARGLGRRRSLPEPPPDIIVAAGHSTHLPLLLLGRRFCAPTVVLMKPTLPLRLFDLCLIPDVYAFDPVPDNVILTTGVLNRVVRTEHRNTSNGLILIGGPSSHHHWSDESVVSQIAEVVTNEPDHHWILATSRRTPATFISLLRSRNLPVEVVCPQDVDSSWLHTTMAACGTAWVTGESVSMLFEAVTAGCNVGILHLDRRRQNRATRCVDQLIERRLATTFQTWKKQRQLHRHEVQLAEADRCAAELLCRFFPARSGGVARPDHAPAA